MKTLYRLLSSLFFAFLPLLKGMEEMPNLQTACFRQPYKSQCMDGKRSQYTIRWFAMGSSCMSYPYGYCPENEVSHVTSTMRTRKACEDLCIINGSSLESQASIKPSVSELVETIPLTQNHVLFNFTCKRQQYVHMCARNVQSQFTFRWFYENGTCLAYPYGFCMESQNSDTILITLKSKEACEIICRPPGQLFIRPTPIYEFVTKLYEFPKLPFWPYNSNGTDEESISSQSFISPSSVESSTVSKTYNPITSSLQTFNTPVATTIVATSMTIKTEVNQEILSEKRLPLLNNDTTEYESEELVTKILELGKDNTDIDNINETLITTLLNNFMSSSAKSTNAINYSTNEISNNETTILEPFLARLNSSLYVAQNFNSSKETRITTEIWPREQKETFVPTIVRKVCEMVNCELSLQKDLNV